MGPPSTPVLSAPRRPALAYGLTALMPGLGHLYCGEVRRGLTVWFAVLAVLVGAVFAFARWVFVPVAPAVVLALAWAGLQAALWADLAALLQSVGARYRLRPINHPLTYVAAFLGLGVLPLGGAALLAGAWWVGSVEVVDQSMFPRLLPGDRVVFDRAAFAERAPRAGELVVVDWPPAARRGVARVVATGGHTVHLRDGRPVIDGRRAEQVPVDALRVPRFAPHEVADLDALAGYLERLGARPRLVTYARRRPAHEDPPPVTLRDDELYLLGDNRDAALAARAFGRVAVDAVLGRPQFVWASIDAEGGARAGRVGLPVR